MQLYFLADGLQVALIAVLALIIGAAAGFFARVWSHDKSLKNAKNEAESIVTNAKSQAETLVGTAKEQAINIVNKAQNDGDQLKKEKINEAKSETDRLMNQCREDIKNREQVIKGQEDKMLAREQQLDNRSNNLDKREENLDRKEQSIDDKKQALEEKNQKLDAIINEQEQKLNEISSLSPEEASKIVMQRTEEAMENEVTEYIYDRIEKAKSEAQEKAKEIIANAIQKYAQDVTNEITVSVVKIPNDELKGRIIGRDGRNIRTIESLTGVDVIVDDTPESIVVSSFDPIRREIARRAIEYLVTDGRIHPGRIEEMVQKAQAEVNQFIRECGDKAIFEVGVGKMHPDLIKILGRLKFRTSYGQNVLQHSIEVAFLAGKMAVELGENEVVAKRAGLLHDIGKAIDHEVEGSHVELGAQLAKKFKEDAVVVNAIESHHGDVEPDNIISCLVQAADALSAARPGARMESAENYINRLESLENIAKDNKGVKEAYCIQAGREIRIFVDEKECTDAQSEVIARNIKQRIEENLTYPGNITVTVIREKRYTQIAK